MSDLEVIATAGFGKRGILVVARLNGRTVATASQTVGRSVSFEGAPGERLADLTARACAEAVRLELEAIAETVKQSWPRCGDERIDPAAAWAPYFTDRAVVAWLEAGVYTAAAAIRLGRAGVGPRQVARQHEPDVTLGLAFTRGEMSVEQLLREVAR